MIIRVHALLLGVCGSANQEEIAVDVTPEEGYLNISHAGVGMAPISCQKQGDV